MVSRVSVRLPSPGCSGSGAPQQRLAGSAGASVSEGTVIELARFPPCFTGDRQRAPLSPLFRFLSARVSFAYS